MSDSITLFHDDLWMSPFVTSVFVALKEKGLAFSTEPVSLANGAQRQNAFAHPSITARVPALKHGDFWLTESTAIVDYIEEAFAAPTYPRVLPADVKERARARQVMGFARTDVREIPQERPTSFIFYPERRTLAQPLTERAKLAAARLLGIADRFIADGRTAVCSEWSIADVDLTILLQRLALNGERMPDKLQRYIDDNWSRPSLQAFINLPRAAYHDY